MAPAHDDRTTRALGAIALCITVIESTDVPDSRGTVLDFDDMIRACNSSSPKAPANTTA